MRSHQTFLIIYNIITSSACSSSISATTAGDIGSSAVLLRLPLFGTSSSPTRDSTTNCTSSGGFSHYRDALSFFPTRRFCTVCRSAWRRASWMSAVDSYSAVFSLENVAPLIGRRCLRSDVCRRWRRGLELAKHQGMVCFRRGGPLT